MIEVHLVHKECKVSLVPLACQEHQEPRVAWDILAIKEIKEILVLLEVLENLVHQVYLD